MGEDLGRYGIDQRSHGRGAVEGIDGIGKTREGPGVAWRRDDTQVYAQPVQVVRDFDGPGD